MPPPMTQTIGKISKLRYAAIIFAALCAMGMGRSSEAVDYAKTPIVFVHGHGMNGTSWRALIFYLMDRGYPDAYLKAITLRPNTGSNIDAAQDEIKPAISKFLQKINRRRPDQKPFDKVDIVAHSMGAVSSRYYAKKIAPQNVRTLITIAGANHGTDALCKFSDPGADDLCPAYAGNAEESEVQFILNGPGADSTTDETPYGIGIDNPGKASVRPRGNLRISFWTVRIQNDAWISPSESAALDGAGGRDITMPEGIDAIITSPGNILYNKNVGHDGLLYDQNVHRMVYAILNLKLPN
jgi:pimeloyl-ACP methyl ester carboxylesterase